jgi:hypothetical protein
MAVDSNGAVIGQYYPGWDGGPDIVVMKDPNGQAFAVYIGSKSFGTAGGLWFTSTDCSGPAFTMTPAPLSASSPNLIPTAVYMYGTAYIPAATQTAAILQSMVTGEGACSAYGPVTQTLNPITETVPLYIYVPPFSVH